MQQFGASAFYTVMHWHKQVEVDNEYTLHISILVEIWRSSDKKKLGHFWHTLYSFNIE